MIGIDKYIAKKQAQIQTFFDELLTASSGTLDFEAYGRAQLIKKEAGNIPEIMDLGTHQYKDALLNSAISGLCFFLVKNDSNESGPISKWDVNIYFAVNLKKLYPTIQERAIEYLHNDVRELLKGSKFNLTNITNDLDAFSEFDLVKDSDNYQPYFLCKYTTSIEFSINEC